MREYEIYVGGLPHTVQLSDREASERGLKPITKAATPPPNKARSRIRNKGA